MTALAGSTQAAPARVGLVAIGRNEGRRLKACFDSLPARDVPIVYVDSGSTDDSVGLAEAHGLPALVLDGSTAFTAARARNAGVDALLARHPGLEYVQFVDADCRLAPGWLEQGRTFLDAYPAVAVVCGRRRELHREHSLYNRLADLEWAAPLGSVATCGGDAMMRVAVFRAAGGFDPALIAGEEPDLCLRIRRLGHEVVRIEAEMTAHDAELLRFSQWWRRAVRWGHGYTEMVFRHGRRTERRWLRSLLAATFWAALLPAMALGGAWATSGASLWLLAAYPVQVLRTALARARAGASRTDAALFGVACCLGKFAEFRGALKFLGNRALGNRSATLIEYKDA